MLRGRAPVAVARVRGLEEDLARAVALLEGGNAAEAAAILRAWQGAAPDAFVAAGGPALLSRSEAALRAAREAEEKVRRLAGLVAERPERAREILAGVKDPAERERLARHLDRFVLPEPPTSGAGASGAGFSLAAAAGPAEGGSEATGPAEAPPLPVADPEAVEARRMEQIERLAARQASGLLQPVAAALDWLALHQGSDGRFSTAAVEERCKALGHDSCLRELRAGPGPKYDVAETALAVLAFLDFRDQDARGVYEPVLARGVAWLLAQMKPDGSIPGERCYYAQAMALMALGQAAGTSGREDLRRAVEKGLRWLHAQAGPDGGYRYGPRMAGDLSVTGWVAQAVEAARRAGIPRPAGMEGGLRRFLDFVWLGGARYGYDRRVDQPTLYPTGMLLGYIVEESPDPALLAQWRRYLTRPEVSPGRARPAAMRPGLYEVYYAVRMVLVLEGALTRPWAGWLRQVVDAQLKAGEPRARTPAAWTPGWRGPPWGSPPSRRSRWSTRSSTGSGVAGRVGRPPGGGGPTEAPMAVEVRFASPNHDLLVGLVEARGVTAGDAPPALAAAIDRLVAERAGQDFPPPAQRQAVRDLLRHGGFRPAGRSKPASEYLVRAATAGAFPRINVLADAGNLFSLETGWPLSLVDLDQALPSGGALEVREGRPGERYVFNPSGQEIEVAGLVGVARVDGPLLANPVKDSLATRTGPGTRNVLAAIFATRRLVTPAEVLRLAGSLADLLREHARAAEVRALVLPADPGEAEA